MGVSTEQWRCAIANGAPLLRVVKTVEKHDEMLSKMRDDSFKLWSFVGVSILWLILVTWVLNQAMVEKSLVVESPEMRTNDSSCGKGESDSLPVGVIQTLLVIGNVELNPGPEMQPKLNLYRLVRQVENHGDAVEFLREKELLPRSIDCEHCFKTLTKIYPENNPVAKFKYFRCKCEKRKRIPVTKDTFFYQANISPKVFLVLAYGFCYRQCFV